MRRSIICLILLLVFSTSALRAADPLFDEPTIGSIIGSNLGKAFQYAQEASEQAAKFSVEMQAARENYFQALQSGIGLERAEAEFQQMLLEKDLAYLGLAVPEGVDGPWVKYAKHFAKFDGGIRQGAVVAFRDWVKAIRYHLGARRKGDLVFFFNPQRIQQAFAATENRRLIYVMARNRVEFFESGIDLNKLFSPEFYAKHLLEELSSKSSVDIEFKRSNPIAEGAKWYDTLVRKFGEKAVLEAAERVLSVQRDKTGLLLEPITVPKPGGKTEDTGYAVAAFTGLLMGTPKGHAIWTGRGYIYSDWGDGLLNGVKFYDGLVSQYGEDKVLQASEAVFNAPHLLNMGPLGVVADFSGAQMLSPDSWIVELLKNPSAQLPANNQMVRLDASDSEGISQALRDNVARAEVFGRVVRIDKIVDGLYLHVIYFEGSTNLVAVYLQTPTAAMFWPYKGDLKGKLIRITGVFKKGGSWLEESNGANLKIFGHKDTEVLDEANWPARFALPPVTGVSVYNPSAISKTSVRADNDQGDTSATEQEQSSLSVTASSEEIAQETVVATVHVPTRVILETVPEPIYTATPVFPRHATMPGWVDVEFVIAQDGRVIDPVVIASKPKGIFDRAALSAIRQWRYTPIEVDGEIVEASGIKHQFEFDPTTQPTTQRKKRKRTKER